MTSIQKFVKFSISVYNSNRISDTCSSLVRLVEKQKKTERAMTNPNIRYSMTQNECPSLQYNPQNPKPRDPEGLEIEVCRLCKEARIITFLVHIKNCRYFYDCILLPPIFRSHPFKNRDVFKKQLKTCSQICSIKYFRTISTDFTIEKMCKDS